MTNHDRLLQFLHDSKKLRQEYLTDLLDHQMRFYMTEFDNEKLIYVANGGDSATLFVFTLRGKFKYNAVVNINGASIGKKSSRRRKTEIPGFADPSKSSILDIGVPDVRIVGTGDCEDGEGDSLVGSV